MDRIAVAMAGRPQVERFLSTVDMFLDEITDPEKHAIFFEIWALASRHPFASNLMGKMMGRERRAVHGLIRALNPAIDDARCRERAVLVVAQIQGLMLFRLDRHARPGEYAAVRASLHNVLLSLATVP
jgi:hypothetical protein